MPKEPLKINYKYTPKLWAAISFLLILVSAFLLFLGRRSKAFRSATLVTTFHDFYHHVSNFSISMLIYMTMGYTWLIIGVKIKHVAVAGIVIVLINFIYELFIPILNTPDIIDAYYGLASVILSFIFLYAVDRYGLTLKRT